MMATYNQQKKTGSVLDDILQCPICCELPDPPIHQCDRGHHLCQTCYYKLRSTECPFCKSQFNGTRNYLAEELVQKLPALIISIENSSEGDTPIIEKKDKKDEAARAEGSSPRLCPGAFPCNLRTCKKVLPAGRMLPHIRYGHSTLLSEVTCSGKYKEVWELEYGPNKSYDAAIRISSMGLFFMLVDMDDTGYLSAFVQMVASEEVASTFKYKIKVSSSTGKKKVSYSDEVHSCREAPMLVRREGQCLQLSYVELTNICEYGDILQCQLTVIGEKLEESESSNTPSGCRSAHRRPRRAARRYILT